MSEADRFKQKFPGRGAPKQSEIMRKRLQGKGGVQMLLIRLCMVEFSIERILKLT